jgi:dihydroorotase
MIEMFATNPQKIMRVMPWGLFEGSDAHITVLDPKKSWKFDVSKSRSKSRNSPFDGREMTGKAVGTIVYGKVVHEDRS